jgi:hypothetical protein
VTTSRQGSPQRRAHSGGDGKAPNGRSASEKPTKYRFAHNVAGRGTVPEHEYLKYAENGSGLEEPDLILNVPVIKVDSIHLQVDDLEAHVALKAQVLDLLKLTVGVDISLGKVRVDLKGIEAQALLKVRLDYVAAAIDRVLSALDRNPELLEAVGSAIEDTGWGAGHEVAETGESFEHFGEGAAEAVSDVGQGAAAAVGELGQGTGWAVEDIGQGGGQAVGDIGEGAGETIGDLGEASAGPTAVVRTTARRLGATASEGAKSTARAVGQATKRRKENFQGRRYHRQAEKHGATDAAVRMSRELKIDIREIKGSGADGRITVRDVRSAQNGKH